nr:MAG TPA: virion morphogenesis protein [Caudoviricetes sp.]
MRGGDKFRQRLAELAAQAATAKVRVGIIEQANYPDGESVAQVAFWNEYGTATIPPRPFFRNTIAEHKDEWPKQAATFMEANGGDVRQTLADMGEVVKGQIKMTIQDFREPPNAAATVKQKGFDKPLINKGTLWDRIECEVTDE